MEIKRSMLRQAAATADGQEILGGLAMAGRAVGAGGKGAMAPSDFDS